MNAVGYESTPAEEMEEETYHSSKRTEKNEKASNESLQTIFDLLSTEVFTDEFVSKIQDSLHTFNQERADKCIEYLTNEIKNKGGKL